MAVTASTFKAEFPEFNSAADALVTAKIADATARVNVDAWGDKADQGVKYLTARLLALSPFGRKMQLVNKDGSTVYDKDYERLMRSVAYGFRVI